MLRSAKPHLIGLLLIVFTCTGALPAQASDMWSKMGRGLSNALTGYYEIVYQMGEMSERERWPVALFGGFAKGLLRGTARTVIGVVEVVTFPLPIPFGYRPIMEPEFIVAPTYPTPGEWPDWGEKYPNP